MWRVFRVWGLLLLAGCTLDLTDVEPDPVSSPGAPPHLSVRIELEVDEPETGMGRIEIDAYFFAGADGEGRLRAAASVWPITLGALTLEPNDDRILGSVRWRAVETVPLEGDTLRFTPPVVEGLAPLPEMVVPIGLELAPMEDIELAPGADVEVAVRFFDDRVGGSEAVQDQWLVSVGSGLSLSGRNTPPTIRLPGDLLDGIELPADLRLRSSRFFGWDDAGAYPAQLTRVTSVRWTVTRTEG